MDNQNNNNDIKSIKKEKETESDNNINIDSSPQIDSNNNNATTTTSRDYSMQQSILQSELSVASPPLLVSSPYQDPQLSSAVSPTNSPPNISTISLNTKSSASSNNTKATSTSITKNNTNSSTSIIPATVANTNINIINSSNSISSSAALTTTSINTPTTTTIVGAQKTQAAFVNKLYTMVEDPSIQHLISWAPSGDVFSVSNPTEFSKLVLPQYFKHNNWQSFVRQLNMYGFHKVNDMFHANPSSESQAWEFKHQDFRRGQPGALQLIKRKSSKHSTSNTMNMKGGGVGGSGGVSGGIVGIGGGSGGLPTSGINQSTGGGGMNDPSVIDSLRDDRIEYLTNQMKELKEKTRQITENYKVLYDESLSFRMLQSKHQQVITIITNLLVSMAKEDDPRRKFEVDFLQAEVAKLAQVDPPSHSSSMIPHYTHPYTPQRTLSTPQPMIGVESAAPPPPSQQQPSEMDYRMTQQQQQQSSSSSSPYPSQHSRTPKINPPSALAKLPEFPFAPSPFQPTSSTSGNLPIIRHRSPEPILNQKKNNNNNNGSDSGTNARSASMDTYNNNRPIISSTSSSTSSYNSTQPHRSSHDLHHSSLPSPHRRSSQPSFGPNFNLLNSEPTNRYKINNNNNNTISISSPSSHHQHQHHHHHQRTPPTRSSTSPSPSSYTINKSSSTSSSDVNNNPPSSVGIINKSSSSLPSSQTRPPPLPDPPDNSDGW